MTLGDKRRKFTEAIALLTLYARYRGWYLAGDMLRRCEGCTIGEDDSLHRLGLAEDMNLYIDGVYIEDERGHDELHDFWDILGGAERISGDFNHYSFEHNGKR